MNVPAYKKKKGVSKLMVLPFFITKTCGKNNKHSSPQNAYSTNFNSLIKRVDFPYFSII